MGALLVAIERLTEAVDRNTQALLTGAPENRAGLVESIAEALSQFVEVDEEDEEEEEEDPPPRRRRRSR